MSKPDTGDWLFMAFVLAIAAWIAFLFICF